MRQGPGTARKPHSHAAAACPSSWTHMLKKMRTTARPGPVETRTHAQSSATGMAQVRMRASRAGPPSKSGQSASAGPPSTAAGPPGSSAAARASALA